MNQLSFDALLFDVQSYACKYFLCLDYFFNLKFFLVCLFALPFRKVFQQFLYRWDHWQYMSKVQYFLISKTSSSQWSAAFWKNIFVFWYSHMIPNFEFRIFLIMFYILLSIRLQLNIERFQFHCSAICIVVLVNCFN